MSGNVISFKKKKLTIEQRRIDYIKRHLTNLRNDPELLTGYFSRPYLGNKQARITLDNLICAANRQSIDWLLTGLGDDTVEQAELAYDAYIGLINWFQDVEVVNARYAMTLLVNNGTEVMQFIFINLEGHILGLFGIYDGNKDIVSGLIQEMNTLGLTNLGFDYET